MARDATRGITKKHVNSSGSLRWFDLGTPKAGDRYDVLSEQAAEALWTLAQPIGSAVLKASSSK